MRVIKNVSVIGLGYVGLPFAIAICKGLIKVNPKGNVYGIDLDKNKILKIQDGILPLDTKDLKLKSSFKKAIKNKILTVSTSYEKISISDVVIVSINFDLNHFSTKKNLFDKNFLELFKIIGKKIKENSILVVQSTIPPGTGDKIIIPLLIKELTKRKINPNKLNYVHSYERVMPGLNYLDSIINNWRCYGTNNIMADKRFRHFANIFINTKKYPLYRMKSVMHSETAKILENSYRALNIAFISEWSIFAQKNNLDLFNIIDGIKMRPTHNNIMKPGLGVGGYCLTKDPIFMSYSNILHKQKTNFKLTNLAVKINKKMPNNSIDILNSIIKRMNKNVLLKTSFILFGIAYKDGIGDTRNSPTDPIIQKLKKSNYEYEIVDPYVDQYKGKKTLNSISKIIFKDINILIFCTGHKEFEKIRFDTFDLDNSYYIVDTNNCLIQRQINQIKKQNFFIKKIGDGAI